MSVRFEDALKAKKLRSFFAEQGRIYIVVDATRQEVVIPDFLKGDAGLRLVLNSRMPQSIHIRDSGVSSNFSFSGVTHHCVIPMDCIWAAYHPDADLDSGLFWEDHVPKAVREMMEAMVEQENMGAAVSSVEVDPEIEAKAVAKVEEPKVEGRKVSHLRVVR